MAIKFPPGARASFIAAAISMVVGLSGTSRSMGTLFTPQHVTVRETGSSEPVVMTRALDELGSVLDEYDRTPERRALMGANVLVSALLFVAGFHLWRRRKNAIWWMTQASLANLVYTGADVLLNILRMHHSPRFVHALGGFVNAAMEAQAQRNRTDVLSLSQVDVVTFATIAIVVGGCLRALVYVWLFWRVRLNDIRTFVAAPEAPPPSE